MVELIIHDLSKKFGNQILFSNFSQTFITGECIAITGTNGSGKSTFLQILSGYTQPASGEIVLLENGEKIISGEYYKKMAFAAPYLDLPGELSIREVFRLHQSLGKIRSELGETEMLQMAGATFYADRPIKYFSSGMLQRAKLTLAFSSSGTILFLDEPTAAVDVQSRNSIMQVLKEMNRQGTTIIYTSHLMDEAQHFCTKVGIIDSGRLVEQGIPEELIHKYAGVHSLEELFLKITGKRLRD